MCILGVDNSILSGTRIYVRVYYTIRYAHAYINVQCTSYMLQTHAYMLQTYKQTHTYKSMPQCKYRSTQSRVKRVSK